MDVVDIIDIIVEIGRQNMADCRRLRPSRDRSLIAESVETGRRA
jgi:hypothetical protein